MIAKIALRNKIVLILFSLIIFFVKLPFCRKSVISSPFKWPLLLLFCLNLPSL